MRRREFIALVGCAAAWPSSLRGEKMQHLIGFIHQGLPEPPSLMNAFKKGLGELGFVEGDNVKIVDRAAFGHYDRLAALASELVALKVSVIAANFLPAALAAK